MLFGRVCQVTVGDPRQNNIIFDQQFRITFDILKNLLDDPKLSKIEIYNLTRHSRDQLKEIMQKNNTSNIKALLTLYAGYEQGDGLELLYRGKIKHIYSRKEPPDVITTLSCVELIEGNSKVSYSGKIDSDTLWNDYVTQYGIGIDDASDLSNKVTFNHGVSFVGTTKHAIRNLSKATNSTATLENNKLKIIPKGKASKNVIVDVNTGNGLLKSPEKIESEGTDGDTDSNAIKDGWKITMLLQPKIKIGGKINLQSETITGIYIADSIEHTGDTATGDWQTIIETKER